ncbi:MAG: DNA mismatch repair endonuclease MutL, partial [Acidobacteriota bacterium]
MAKVRVLPQVLAHQIAAGEVIERPASVVKELVENALDAEATQIHVYVEEGGKRILRVTDDGHGMSAEDAKLAFVHHATSKIVDFDDLMDIRTLGFRGEALPSIASVARVTLRTVDSEGPTDGSPLGTEIAYAAGELRESREITWPRGTEVTVEDLFYNVPARRKFLKTVATELSHISRLVMCYALAFPGVEFRLTHQNKSLIEAPSVENPGDRIFQLMGDSLTQNLVPMEYSVEGVAVSGFTSLPHEQRNGANGLYLFVNRRMVRDRVLTHAIR